MANLMIPEGYEKLAAIGIAYKGVYDASKAYGILNAVYHNGSTFVSLKDGPEGEPTGDGVNWQYMAKGFVEGLLSGVQAKDTSGIIGTAGEMVNAQSLLDVIADRVANKLIDKNKVINNLTSTDENAVLAAPQGKMLMEEIGEVNRKLARSVFSTYKVFVINTTPNGDVTIPLNLTTQPVFLYIAANINTYISSKTTYFGSTYGNITTTLPNGAVSGLPQTTRCVHLVDSENGIFAADVKSLSKESLVLTIANTSTSPYSAWLYITVY